MCLVDPPRAHPRRARPEQARDRGAGDQYGFAPLGRVGMTEAFPDRSNVLERYSSATRRPRCCDLCEIIFRTPHAIDDLRNSLVYLRTSPPRGVPKGASRGAGKRRGGGGARRGARFTVGWVL